MADTALIRRSSVALPTMRPATYATRESWLLAAIEALRPMFASHGYTVPDEIRVSCGFPLGSRTAVGQAWSRDASADKTAEIFVTPSEGDAVEVIDTLRIPTQRCRRAARRGRSRAHACARSNVLRAATRLAPPAGGSRSGCRSAHADARWRWPVPDTDLTARARAVLAELQASKRVLDADVLASLPWGLDPDSVYARYRTQRAGSRVLALIRARGAELGVYVSRWSSERSPLGREAARLLAEGGES